MDGGTQNAIMDMLVNAPPLVAFAGYLIWQSKGQQKRLDDLTASWMTQINALEDKSTNREDKLRDRYDQVLDKVEKEKNSLLKVLAGKMSDVTKAIVEMRSDIKGLFGRLEKMEDELQRIKNENT